MDLKELITVNKVLLFLFLVSLFGACQQTNKEKEKKDEPLIVYTHLHVGYPSESMNLADFTDTLEISVLDDGTQSVTPFTLLNLINDSLAKLTEENIQFKKRIDDSLSQIYFGDYIRQYMAYVHDQYGLIYLARTDWEKDEFKIINHYKYPLKEVNKVLDFCVRFHENRKLPPPATERKS